MASTPRLGTACILPLAAALASGCVVVRPPAHPQPQSPSEVHTSQAQGGPPPWAPAHGYRRKHRSSKPARDDGSGEVRIVFDSERGVHVVLGLSDHYWDAGRYYRCDGGKWRVSARVEGPWVSVEVRDVPIALVRAAASKDVYPARRAD